MSMSGRVDSKQLAFQLEEQISRAFLNKAWRRFTPRQFDSLTGGNTDLAIRSLNALADVGYLNAFATIKCDRGHSVWSGPVEQIEHNMHHVCRECDEPDADRSAYFLHFEITDEWAERLKKKTRRTVKGHLWRASRPRRKRRST